MKRVNRIDLGFAGACLFFCLLTMILNWNSSAARMLMQGQRVSGLLIGSDFDGHARHSDTLMYVSYDPTSRFLDILSIPRDTQVRIANKPSVRRVNEIFAYEFRHTRRDFDVASMALKGEVETLLSSGTAQSVKIPFYFTVDYKSFKALIDAMGGVYVRVTEPMNYDDNWGHLHIHFEPGTYLMNGQKALEYVRFRGSTADQGRVLRQQIFIKEVLKRLQNPMVLFRLPRHAGKVLDGIHTNFSLWDMFILMTEARRMGWKNLRLFAVPGTPQGALWKMNTEMTQHILGLMDSPVETEPVTQEPLTASSAPHMASTVEVWNASNQPYAAKAVVQMLRDKGFDVVVSGNFATRQQRTLVIDRSGKLRPAQAVADVLRAARPEVVSRVDPSRQVDVSVILGNDATFSTRKGMKWR